MAACHDFLHAPQLKKNSSPNGKKTIHMHEPIPALSPRQPVPASGADSRINYLGKRPLHLEVAVNPCGLLRFRKAALVSLY